MLDAITRGGGRFAGVAMVDDSFTETQIGALHDAGVRGARFNFVAHLGGAPDLDVFWRVVRRIAAFGWHVVLHFDARDLVAYADLLDRLPVPYIIDHMARIDASAGLDQEPFALLCELVRDERAWVKISGAERLTASWSAELRRRRPVRPSAHRRRAGTDPLGHRLATPQRARDAGRR